MVLFSFGYGNKICYVDRIPKSVSRNSMARLQRNVPSLDIVKPVRLLGNIILYFTVMCHDSEHKNYTKKRELDHWRIQGF